MAETLLEKAQRLGIKPAGQPVAQQPTTQTTSSGPVQSETLLQKAQRLGIKPANAPAASVQTPTIPNVKETRKQKIERLKQEAAAAQENSDKINSPFNQYVRPVADAVLPGVSNLGDTISGIVNTNLQGPELESQIQSLDNLQNSILRQIKDRHAKGKDATDLEQEYNSTSGLIDRLRAKFKESTKSADKTTGQVAGELVSTALDVLSAGTYSKVKGAAEATPSLITAGKEALQTTAPLLSRETGKQILKGVATAAPVAYGYDVAAGLQGERGQDRTGANAFIPGLTTAVGATIGGALPALSAAENSYKQFRTTQKIAQENIAQKQAVSGLEKNIYDVETKYAKSRKMQAFEKDGGKESRSRIAASGVLDGSIDENGVIRTKDPGGAVDQYKAQAVSGTEGFVRNSLIDEGKTLPLSVVRETLVKKVRESGLHGEDLVSALQKIDKEIQGYKLAANIADEVPLNEAMVPLVLVHDAKVNHYDNINFQTSPDIKKYRKSVANALKALVEKTSDLPINEYNSEIGKYLQDIKRLEALDGARVDGGKIGRYVAQIAGNITGAIAGSTLGPAGSAVGSMVGGEVVSKIKANNMQRVFSNKGKAPTFQKSQIIENAAKRNAELKLKNK